MSDQALTARYESKRSTRTPASHPARSVSCAYRSCHGLSTCHGPLLPAQVPGTPKPFLLSDGDLHPVPEDVGLLVSDSRIVSSSS
jgi:hypothetical protein